MRETERISGLHLKISKLIGCGIQHGHGFSAGAVQRSGVDDARLSHPLVARDV